MGWGGQTGSEIDEWVTLLAAVTRVRPADGVGGGAVHYVLGADRAPAVRMKAYVLCARLAAGDVR